MRARLMPLDGGPALDLLKEMVVLGRKEDCDIRLDHKGVSKMHCVIVRADGLLLLRDLGSTNGTRVNGIRVRRAALLPNDQITIAGFGFRVFLGPDEQAAVPNQGTQEILSEELHFDPVRKANADIPLRINELPDVYPNQEKKG